jgi:hypothetical protein
MVSVSVSFKLSVLSFLRDRFFCIPEIVGILLRIRKCWNFVHNSSHHESEPNMYFKIANIQTVDMHLN